MTSCCATRPSPPPSPAGRSSTSCSPGIGGHLPGAPAAAVGHLLAQSFDAGGELIHTRPADRAIAIDADRLRATRVMAVAGGEEKHAAVVAALRTGLLDVLVCDAATAAHALAA